MWVCLFMPGNIKELQSQPTAWTRPPGPSAGYLISSATAIYMCTRISRPCQLQYLAPTSDSNTSPSTCTLLPDHAYTVLLPS